MDGDQKAWVIMVMTVALLLGWGIWNFAAYSTTAASMRPSTDAVLSCVNTCARSCAAETTP